MVKVFCDMCGRADYAERHPWRNLWAWAKRKAKME